MLYSSDSLPTASASSTPAGTHARSATVAKNPGQLSSPAFGSDASRTVQTTLTPNQTPNTDGPVPADNAAPVPPTMSPVPAPMFVRDLPPDDRLAVLLAVNDTMQSTMNKKIHAAMDEQDAANTDAVADSTIAAGSSQEHAALPPSTPARRPKFVGANLSPGLDPTVGGSGGRPSHAIVFDHA